MTKTKNFCPNLDKYADGHVVNTLHLVKHQGLSNNSCQFIRKMEKFFFDEDLVDDFAWEAFALAVENGVLNERTESCSIAVRCRRSGDPAQIGSAGKYGDIKTSYVRVCFGCRRENLYYVASLYPIAEYQVDLVHKGSFDIELDEFEKGFEV